MQEHILHIGNDKNIIELFRWEKVGDKAKINIIIGMFCGCRHKSEIKKTNEQTNKQIKMYCLKKHAQHQLIHKTIPPKPTKSTPKRKCNLTKNKKPRAMRGDSM